MQWCGAGDEGVVVGVRFFFISVVKERTCFRNKMFFEIMQKIKYFKHAEKLFPAVCANDNISARQQGITVDGNTVDTVSVRGLVKKNVFKKSYSVYNQRK